MILDQYGREIKSNKPILDEIALQTVRDRYGSYPSHGLTPERLARIFKEADQGDVTRQAELFEEMEEKDLHLTGTLQTRKLAVTGLEWEILPASDSTEDKNIAAAAKEMIEYIEHFDDALLDILDAVGKGFSVGEIMWDISEGKIWIKDIEWVHQRRFTFNSPTVLLKTPKLITDDAPVWGEDLPPNKFVVHRYKARSGATPRGGLLRPCAYMYLFKNYDIKDWLIFNELFSVPMRIGKYKPGTPPKEIDALKQAVFNLGVDAAAVVSDSTLIELIESKVTGSNTSFKDFADFCDKAMSKAILGHTGSAEGTPGKLGDEDQAGNIRQDLLESDAKALMTTIKFQVLAPWVAFNYGPDKGVPKFKLHFEEDDDLEKTARVYGILVKDMNFDEIPADHVHERFGIPKPIAGQKTVRPAQTGFGFPFTTQDRPPVMPGADRIANKAGHVIMKNTSSVDDWITLYMERLRPSLQGARTSALDEIERYLKSLPTPPTEETLQAKMAAALGTAYSTVNKEAIAGTISELYMQSRNEPGIAIGFGGPDIRSINFLSELDGFYVSKWVKNPDAINAVRSFLSERYLEQGAGLFGRGKPDDIQAFRDLFNQKLTDLEDWQVRRVIDTSVPRVQNWASLSQLNEAGIVELEVYEPTQECDFCKAMNGKIIRVDTAYSAMMQQAAMTPDEYEQAIKRISPTIDNIEQFVARGILPPYHPHCRGIVIKRVI
jgi:phage gp29-like protein